MKPYSLEKIRIIEEKMITYEIWVFALVLFVAVLLLIVVMQKLALAKFKSSELFKLKQNLKSADKDSIESQLEDPNIIDVHTITQTPVHHERIVTGKDLPEPGMIYKYSIPNEGKRIIVIGQREGNIVTHSTEILDHHLRIDIFPIDVENKEYLSYQIEFRREGKVLCQLPNQKDFLEMEMKETIQITKSDFEDGFPIFPSINTETPLRLRLGGRLSVEGKFKIGFFEFHFYTKDILERTSGGTKRIEKQFYLKLYKIFPGYDTARQSRDGVVPMLERFGGKV
ncbi:hypothetical protein CH369_05540 [Leptospira levettii]|uniref:hypothetical protein n=1 Tax=Leptospira levettii TaxID=2023178 RepID=UPI000C2977E9|nr:hypothetical protein [Leptospira levettii]PJZ87382.1 hypothetical protein CH368_17135 [Leptospira levettii]PKA01243.1 hypothetical protein CH369_05540 [Leptospira levettii]